MTTLQEIFVDINGANRYVTVSAKAEDDAGRIVLINLLDNGALYALPAGAEARAVMIRPNGTKALITAQVIDGKVQLTMKSSMLILGTSQVEILLSTTDGKVITTAKFAIKVHGTQSTAGMEQSDDWSALRDALSKLSQVPAAEDVATLKAAVALVNGRLHKQAQTTHIQAVLAAKFKPTAEGTYEAPVYLNLTSAARQYGTALALADGGVKIGKGVNKVRITGQAYMYESTALTQCEMDLYIVKADGTATRVERCICTRSGKYETYITGPIVTAVSEGDIIKLAYIGKPDTSFINYNDSTMLNVTVEEWDLSTAAGADLSADDVLLNKWHTGTAIDGAAGSESTYPASGISSAFIGDLYLNLSTGTVYQCTATGTADKATWKYMTVLSNVGDGTVQAKHLAEGAALGNIGLNSITSAKIADRAITSAKIGYGAVEQDNIKEGAVTTLKIGSKALKAWHFSDSIIGKGLLTDALAKEITAATTGLAEVKEELAGAGETWEPVFSKAFDADTTANQRWDLAKPCKKIRLRMAVAGSVANSAAGDQTVYMNSYTSKCFLPNAFRYETATTKGAFVVAEIEIAEDMVRVLVNKGNISSGFNAANLMTGGAIWAASGITFNIFKDTEGHGAIKALSFPTNGKTIGAGTQIEILGVAK
ncbi:MAG: BppU family phage baseplate upper protein [Acutalibacteraceae bacterium]|nr:BppU family phage baseplate upper protein [Acutalibacteraceae bacterium]